MKVKRPVKDASKLTLATEQPAASSGISVLEEQNEVRSVDELMDQLLDGEHTSVGRSADGAEVEEAQVKEEDEVLEEEEKDEEKEDEEDEAAPTLGLVEVVHDDELVTKRDRTVVWVHGFSRSGSSTLLSMFTEAWPEMVQGNQGSVFSLFEPCSEGDELSAQLVQGGCSALLDALAKCDFLGIRKLNGWYDTHSLVSGIKFKQYSSGAAKASCETASLVAFKTISHVERPVAMPYRLSVLEDNSDIFMIDIVRDPRSIYASVMNTYPFNLRTKRAPQFLVDICDTFAQGLNVTHDRIHRIVFEEFVTKPMEIMKNAYNFIGADFGALQLQWILAHVNAKSCPDQVKYPWKAKYSDCSMDSKASLLAFRSLLNEAEMELFQTHPSCVRVAQAYGYSA